MITSLYTFQSDHLRKKVITFGFFKDLRSDHLRGEVIIFETQVIILGYPPFVQR